ncbi:serine/threonine-protein kinase OXI1-like [Salvia miltiorrhiza]|uniref:serine/threonine-protein kinase OXI1-like n=1 Tax=Salvia miltiorrhiza TaxID=226208 RepID=UPI0025AD2380|nr:serine/threonine-protein kinase OXI1-like [Salvia miltiorrhiza]
MHGGDATPSLQLSSLQVISAIGRGANGVVFLVRTDEGELLALKAILESSNRKTKVEGGEDCRRTRLEREFLSSFDHPLLPKLHGVVITDKIVGYAIDFCPGRDLNSLRKKQTEKIFSDDIIRFYAAELVLALEYLHGLRIVYRDLKPENVMIQSNGHLMLVDFDLSTKLTARSRPETFPLGGESVERERSNSFVGTEDYIAPEIVLGSGHSFAVDWWCFGVVLYEMRYGTTPFRGPDRRKTYRRIVTEEPELTGELTPLKDLIGKLLVKDPKKRICRREIKVHDFFKAVDWEGILELPRPPFIPDLTDVEVNINEQINLEEYVQRVFDTT